MLLALMSAFALSQAFRTVAAIMAPPLQQAFALTPQHLGLFAGAFHFAFGGLQLAVGIALDVYGVRRTVLAVFPFAVGGALVTAMAPSYPWLAFGQMLTGIGCAPAFLVCTIFIARSFPAERFAPVSGIVMGLGSVGLLLTGTPMAWIIEAASWRAGFVALSACAALAWLVIFLVVKEPPWPEGTEPVKPLAALRGYGELFSLRHTLGILALALFTYAAFLSLRGLWLGPMLIDRHGFTLVGAGNVAILISLVGMSGPAVFGRLDPGPSRRRAWIVGVTLAVAAMFGVMAFVPLAALDVGLALLIGVSSGYIVLQYADVKAAYPVHMTGRAMAVFTMAMFLGVAIMQWLTGAIASAAKAHGADPYQAVLGAIALELVLGAVAFKVLPGPAQSRA